MPGIVPRLLLPDLAAMLAMTTLFYSLFVFGGAERFFRDSDTGWHIRTGEWILAHHALPSSDLYSFSNAGRPWFLWEWGSDVLMGLVYRIDSLRGITALVALTVSACAWMWARLSFAAGGDFLLTALLAPPMITTASLHWLARPHVFSWLFLLGCLLYAESCSRLHTTPRLAPVHLGAVAAMTALWASLHASFFLAPVIALIYAGSHFVRPLIWPFDQALEKKRASWFLLLALAAASGSLINPYGWRLHAHVFSYLLDRDLTTQVAEFQSFNFQDKDATQVALTVAIAGAGAILALSQRKIAHFLLSALFVWGGLRSARVLPLVAILILPLANGAFTEALRNVRGLRSSVQRRISAALGYSSRLREIDRSVGGLVVSPLVVLVLLIALRAPAFSRGIGFSASQFPVNAAQAVEKLPVDARIVSPDSYGGYLIYRFNGARKVYFDGRSDFYGAAFMKQYLVLSRAQRGWQAIVRSFGFTHALLPEDSALKAALQQAGWTTLYKDDVASLLEAH